MSMAVRENLILHHHYLFFGFQMHINTSHLVHLQIWQVTCAATDNMINEAKQFNACLLMSIQWHVKLTSLSSSFTLLVIIL